MLPVLVLCGGRGTRLSTITTVSTPKALVPVAGRAFIDHKLANLARLGFRQVVLSTGVGGEAVGAHVGDGSTFGVDVRYVHDGPRLLGTGGAVQAALGLLPDAFWVTYGDSLVDVDAARVEATFRASGQPALMTVLRRREGGRVASNARVDGDRVVEYRKEPPPTDAAHIDYGLLVMTREAFGAGDWEPPFDLAVVLGGLAEAGRLAAFEAHRPFHDMGTPETLRDTEAYLEGRLDSGAEP